MQKPKKNKAKNAEPPQSPAKEKKTSLFLLPLLIFLVITYLLPTVGAFFAFSSGASRGNEKESMPETEPETNQIEERETRRESMTDAETESETESADTRPVPPKDNLFTVDWEPGGLNYDGSENDNDTVRTGFNPVEPQTVYTVSMCTAGMGVFTTTCVYEYDAQKRFIRASGRASKFSPYTFSTSAETAYLRFAPTPSVLTTVENARHAGYCLEKGTESSVWGQLTKDLTHDEPTSEGVSNALRRVSIFTDTVTVTSGGGMTVGYTDPARRGTSNPYNDTVLKAGDALCGFPYSSVRKTDAYIGAEVSIDTYLSALANPTSILYTQNYQDKNDPGYAQGIRYAWSPYGSVCSVLVGYALNLPIRYTTYEWERIPGMHKVDTETDTVRLGDVACNVTDDDTQNGHMSIVTDILRDADGNIVYVEISEAGIPTMSSSYMRYSYFTSQYLKTFSLYRYDGIDVVPAPDSKILAGEDTARRVLGIDRGNRSVYRLGDRVTVYAGEQTVREILVSYSADGESYVPVTVTLTDASVTAGGVEYPVRVFTPDAAGYYKLIPVLQDGETATATEFSVCDTGNVTYADGSVKTSVGQGDTVTVNFTPPAGCTPYYVCIENTQYGTRRQRLLTEEEIASGSVELLCDMKQTGSWYVLIYYQNEYGRITSARLKLKTVPITENQ